MDKNKNDNKNTNRIRIKNKNMIIIIRKRKKKRKNKRNIIIYFLVPLRVCWVDFGSFWGVLVDLLEVLEGLKRLLGGSWEVLGAS